MRIERRAKWYPSKIDVAEGVLVLTDRRLVFVPHSGMSFFSPRLGSAIDAAAAGSTGIPKAKPRVDLACASIRAIETTKRQRLAVTDVKGRVYRFEVTRPEEWQAHPASRPRRFARSTS